METCQGEKLTDGSDIDTNFATDIDIGKKLNTDPLETRVHESHERSEENMIVDVALKPSGGSSEKLRCGSELENQDDFQSVRNEVNVGEHGSPLDKGPEGHDFVDGTMCSRQESTVPEDIWFECKEIILEMVQYVSDEIENLSSTEMAKDGSDLDVDNDSSSDEDGLFLHREDIGKSTHEGDIDQSSIASSDTNLTDCLNDSKISGDSLHEAKEADSENPLGIDKAGKILTLWNQITEGSNTTNEELIELIAQKLEEEKSKLSQDTNNKQLDLSHSVDSVNQYGNGDAIAKSNETYSKQETQTFPGEDFANKSHQESSTAETDEMDFNSSVKLQKSLVNEPNNKSLTVQNKSNLFENSAQNTDPNSKPNSTMVGEKKEAVTSDIICTDLSQGSLSKEDTTMVSSNKHIVAEPEKVKPNSKSASTVSEEYHANSEPLSSDTQKVCVDEANKTNVNKGNMTQNELEKKTEKPVIIDLESQSDTNIHAKDNTLVRRGEITPVKQIRQDIMQTPSKTPARHPIHMRSPGQMRFGGGASPSTRQTPLKGNNTPGKSPASTPSKKNFIENLIATGIPIIIPDDDDTMPQERSQEFKMKSKQYQQESLKGRSQYRGNNERSPDRLIENTNNNLANMFTPPRSKPVERLNTIFPVPPSNDFRTTSSKPFSLTPPARNSSRGPFQLHTRPVAPNREALAYPETQKRTYSMSHGFSPGRPNTGIAMQGQGQSQPQPIASLSQFIRRGPQMPPQLRHIPPKSTMNPPAARGNISGTLVIIDDDTPTPKVTKPPNLKKRPMQQVQCTQQQKLSTEVREPLNQVQTTQQRKLSSEVQRSSQVQARQQGKLQTEVPEPLMQVQAAQQSKSSRETQQPYMQAHIAQQRKLMTEVLEAGKVQATQRKKVSTEIQDSPMPIITNVQSMASVQNESNDADKNRKQSALPSKPSEKSAGNSEGHDKITIKQEPPDEYEQTASAATMQKTSQDNVTAKRDRQTETDEDKIPTASEPLSKRIKIEPGTEEKKVSNKNDLSQLSEPRTKDNPVSNPKILSQVPDLPSSSTTEKVPLPSEKAQITKEKPEPSKDVLLRQTRKCSRDKAEKQIPAEDKRDEETLDSPSKRKPEVFLDVDVDDAESYHSNLSLEQILQQMPSVSERACTTAGDQKTDSDTSSLKVHSRKNISKNEKDSGTDSEITSSEDGEKGKGDRLAKGDKSQKQFGCGDCGKTYSSKQSLAQHFKVHTREQPFECDVCGKHFSMKTSLKKHIYTHFKERQ